MTFSTDELNTQIYELIKSGKVIKDPLSVGVAHPVVITCAGGGKATGTGFFYSYKKQLFFITAGHNVSGKDPHTGNLSGIPEELGVMLCNIEKDVIVGWRTHIINLSNHSVEQPVWLEHPQHGLEIDVVAMPINLPQLDGIKIINEIRFDNDLPIQVGMDVFVLGYPHGYSAYPTILPIWKRGTLATEFTININRQPKAYIDTATAKGMSGAPVIAKIPGMYLPEGKDDHFSNYVWNGGRRFLGIYTGRRTDQITAENRQDIFNAQLGILWKETAIQEIVMQFKKLPN